jgi:hypothetical protein
MWLTRDGGLFVTGPSGATCQIQSRPDLLSSTPWSNWTTLTLTGGVNAVPGTVPAPTGSRYYRAVATP